MKAIVTGATGSVGNGLVYELIENGYEVLVLSRGNSNRNKNIPVNSNVRISSCSLEELGEFDTEDGSKYDIFFHLAWKGTTGIERNDIDIQMSNVSYTMDAVKLAERLGCHTFVGIGSQAEYGKVNTRISSDTLCNPQSAYGAAKLSASHLSRVLADQKSMRHVWVRLLTVYGPYDGAGFVAPTIRTVHMGNIPKFTKGEQIWDFLYYKDAGNALRLIGEKGVGGKTYVIGCGVERTLMSYITDMNTVLSPDIQFGIGAIPYSNDQIMYLCADNTEVTSDVGWVPQTDFSKGIKETEHIMLSRGMIDL